MYGPPASLPPSGGSNAGLSLSTDGLVDYAAGDLDGDGKQDLVWLKKTGSTSGRIKVALSDGTNYGDAQEWWSGDTVVPVNGAKLLIGDFHADGRQDVAIFGRGTTDSTSRLVVLKRSKYANATELSNPVLWLAVRPGLRQGRQRVAR